MKAKTSSKVRMIDSESEDIIQVRLIDSESEDIIQGKTGR